MSINQSTQSSIVRRSVTPTIPMIDMSPTGGNNNRSGRSTPVIETTGGNNRSGRFTPVIEASSTDDRDLPRFSNTSNIEAMLIKQSKQIRALYEVQKSTLEKVSIIQGQFKKLTSTKNTDLSSKVFGVSNHNYISCRYINNY